MLTGNVNLWAVLGAAASAMVLGMLWYGPLFGKQWMKMMGFTERSMKSMRLTAGQAMGMGTAAQLVVAFVLAKFVSALGVSTAVAGLQLAFWLWLGFSAPLLLGSFLWENKPFKLWVFNAAHRLIELSIMAVILTRWA